METTLRVKKDRLIADVQGDFNKAYPFLKIEFFRKAAARSGYNIKEHLPKSTQLAKVGLTHEGSIKIDDSMTVGELEKLFRERFGANIQVSRKSGTLWLETTMTDNWTLQRQNEHGRELSSPEIKDKSGDEVDYA